MKLQKGILLLIKVAISRTGSELRAGSRITQEPNIWCLEISICMPCLENSKTEVMLAGGLLRLDRRLGRPLPRPTWLTWRQQQAEGYSRRQLSFFAAAEDSKPASVPRRTVASLNWKFESDAVHLKKSWLFSCQILKLLLLARSRLNSRAPNVGSRLLLLNLLLL